MPEQLLVQFIMLGLADIEIMPIVHRRQDVEVMAKMSHVSDLARSQNPTFVTRPDFHSVSHPFPSSSMHTHL